MKNKGKRMKKWLTWSNLATVALLGLALYSQAPSIANNIRTEGTTLSELEVKTILPKNSKAEEKTSAQFPPASDRAIAIFWSTTCGPCKVEMARLKSSVEAGKIPRESLFAINPFESTETISRFLERNPYPFTFIHVPGIAHALGVRATPTTIFIDKGEITSMSSGMSLTGIWKAESFFN